MTLGKDFALGIPDKGKGVRGAILQVSHHTGGRPERLLQASAA